MRRKILLLAAIAVATLALTAQSAVASSPVAPYDSHPRDRSYSSWLRVYGRWLLGDESNPLVAGLSGDCGQMRNGVFFLAPPIDVGLQF